MNLFFVVSASAVSFILAVGCNSSNADKATDDEDIKEKKRDRIIFPKVKGK